MLTNVKTGNKNLYTYGGHLMDISALSVRYYNKGAI